MKEYIIVTNNSLVFECHDERFTVESVAEDLGALYEKVGEMLQNGFKLISSPLPANVPLIRSPIRSIILQAAEKKYDTQGIITLEKAKERTAVLGINADAGVLSDLKTIDRDQLTRAKKQLEILNQEIFNERL